MRLVESISSIVNSKDRLWVDHSGDSLGRVILTITSVTNLPPQRSFLTMPLHLSPMWAWLAQPSKQYGLGDPVIRHACHVAQPLPPSPHHHLPHCLFIYPHLFLTSTDQANTHTHTHTIANSLAAARRSRAPGRGQDVH